MPVIAVNPHRCRVWSLHPRLDETLTEASCSAELESFEKHGQLIPALGRRLRGNRDHDIELIYGARRLFVARLLGMPLQVDVREIPDREGIVAMDAENRLRKDISPYERATSYARWLREGHFRSQGEIAEALQLSHAQISRLLKLVKLPKDIIDAFERPSEICESWGERLANLIVNPNVERQMVHAARQIASATPRLAADKVFAELCAAAKASRSARATDRIVTGVQGDELFRIKHQQHAVVFKISLEHLSRELLADVEQTVARVFESGLALATAGSTAAGSVSAAAAARRGRLASQFSGGNS